MPGTDPTADRLAHPPGAGGPLRAALEGAVLLIVVLAPWAFGAVHPAALFAVYCGVALVLALWAAVLVADRRLAGLCPVVGCLAGLVLLGVTQAAPLPAGALGAVSPATAALRAELLPAEPESLRGDPPVPPPEPAVSLDPGATRREVVKWLALLGLFGAVRYGVARPGSFRRLAVACVANGALLSAFALAQRFSSGPQTIYWSFETQGSVFGPFVCKNHFPYYANVCFGLGLGLLLGSPAFRGRATAAERLAALGRHPGAAWLLAALGLMAAANLYSLSRGGLVAMVGAGAGVVILAAASGRRSGGLAAVCVVAALAVGLVGWFGAGAVEQRVGTLGQADALDAGRRDLWARTVPLVTRFPLWGTGYGTFATVEPPARKPGDADLAWEHAHNDYLEALVEGGLVGFGLVVAALLLVFRAALRAVARAGDSPDGWLALGGLFGLLAVAVHSAADFGLHMPAVAALVAVLAAHLTAAGAPDDGPQLPGWAVLPVAVGCLVAAAVLPADGWKRARAEHYRLAAVGVFQRHPQGERGAAVEYLRAAVAHSPDDAALRAYLADTQYEEYLARRAADPDGAARECLQPAVREYLLARRANPLLPRPHARLAGVRARLHNPDTALAYLTRATRLRPIDGELWYLRGLAELDAGNEAATWEAWRNALGCSPAQLELITAAALPRLGAAGLVANVLPADPALLEKVARAKPLADRPDERKVLVARALELSPDAPRTADEAYRRAWLLREAGRTADAIRAYELALGRAPDRADWRLELAELCLAAGDLGRAAEHAGRAARERPDLAAAADLVAAVVRARSREP